MFETAMKWKPNPDLFCFYLFFATRGEKATSNQRVEPTPQSWENTSLTTRLQGHVKTLAAVFTTDSHPMPTRLPSATLHKSADESGVVAFLISRQGAHQGSPL